MKKVILSTALCLGFAFAANAQNVPPTPGANSTAIAEQRVKQFSVRGPLAPATLLLLGLAGGFAGVKVYRNNKNKEE